MKVFNIKSKRQYVAKLALLAMPLMPLVSSCDKDFLDAQPDLTVLEENAFSTPQLVLAQVNGLYGSLKHGRLLGGRYQIFNDVRAEEFVNRTSNNVTAYSVWNQTNGADDTYTGDVWTRGYLTINRVNIFLQRLAENPGSVPAETAVQYAAEAKFIRAMAYFSLVQMYATPYVSNNGNSPGIPLRLQAEFTSANNEKAKSTVAEIYAQILKDLNEAEAELPARYGTGTANSNLNVTRAHKNTAIALKTRVYLTMGRYADVITEANKIVPAGITTDVTATGSVRYSLPASLSTVFNSTASTESIFSAPFSDLDAPGTQNQLGYYYNAGNIEFTLNTATGIYANPQFRATDARKSELTVTYTGLTAQPRILTKYSAVSPFTTWVPLIRYAEVLLNLAEAEARVGDQTRALALLLTVHRRSDADWVYVPTSQTELINAILTERRIELLGEGFRTNDIFRTGQSIMSRGAGSASALATIAPTDPRYLMPIPTAEILANSAL